MSLSIETIKERIKQYEEELVKVVANHTGLTAALGELKQLLSVASQVAEVIVPSAVEPIDIAQEIVTAIDTAIAV